MQTLIQIICTPGRSLREEIGRDYSLATYNLKIVAGRKLGRSPGWMKVKSSAADGRGSLNIEWSAATKILTCRVVNKGQAGPTGIIGDFVNYVLEQHRHRVDYLSVVRIS